ncbi:DHA2 family efflux MFS transporter permease subunit [Mitsuaria sp. TWR114]|uniref:DHA2 family efflux MFS transporter permease subunit n=1 Tax=Mitsuaria sp. TWR114 TaxID=2601731 RepID=UPI0011BFB404|nr:DHA2 family efflux MFS transporter permease subunit [Mitsuaria sp. TWR114]TXD97243.1 DHA2 family efflux MFS transporter permease subunit [Mitsuaria sp. TWR114]
MNAAIPDDQRPLEGGQLWLAAIVLAAANFIAVLDMTIANVSVPDIAGSLGISSSQGTWVITSYAVAEACIVPLTGWIAGRFGAVRVFATAMVLFGLCSALCGLSPTLGLLVTGRVLQGLSGGSLMPLSQTLLLRIFPKEKAGGAMALWAMTTLVAPILGPILGGWLCDAFSWPLIFFINVPIALVVAPLAWRMLRRYETPLERQPIDRVGLVLLIVFVGALQLMLDLGKEKDWFESTEIIALAVVAAIGFVAFLIWELTEPYPIVDLRVFRHRGFAVGVLTIALGFGAMFGANVLTPLWLQSYMGYTSTWAGLATAWSGVLAVAAAPIAGKLAGKVDPRPLVFFGLAWLGAVMVLRTVGTTQMGYWQIALPLLLAAPITVLSSRARLGERMRRAGLLLIPEESQTPTVLRNAWAYGRQERHLPGFADLLASRRLTALAAEAMGRRDVGQGMRAQVRRQRLEQLSTQPGALDAMSNAERMRFLSEPGHLLRLAQPLRPVAEARVVRPDLRLAA